MNPFSKLVPTQQQVDLEIFTIFDSKSKSYEIPSFAINADVMRREIFNLFRDPSQAKNKLLVNAEDYSLFKIGTYNRRTGEIESQTMEHVLNLHDLRAILPQDIDRRPMEIGPNGQVMGIGPT